MLEHPKGHRIRCAVYTRKSSEEGLEQDFNSLQAQREACEAYIKSQRHEGWEALRAAYDDGGYSGGSLERPALQRLLADVRAGRIDVIVVYKVDRLTRSLADFAKIVENFEQHGVSFVSITQQFNTTSSMGRLTLNVLLSFAQFEREVTGERIRDKFAASKKKGMWMGGYVPLGYRVFQRKLVVHQKEAVLARNIFNLYLKLRNVRLVAADLQRRRMLRPAATARTGRAYGGNPFSRGHLYKILANPIYVGEIHHRGQRYQGQHQRIVERKVWDAVQTRLAANWGERRAQKNAKEPSLLAGLLYDDRGRAFATSHTNKGARRYRYYVSAPRGDAQSHSLRIAAHELERPLVDKLKLLLSDRAKLIGLLRPKGRDPASLRVLTKNAHKAVELLDADATHDKRALLLALVHRIVVSDTEMRIEIEREGLRSALASAGISERVASATQVQDSAHPAPAIANKPRKNLKRLGKSLTIRLPIQLKRRGVETRLIIDGAGTSPPSSPDPALLKAVSRASAWFEHLTSGGIASLSDLATREKLTVSTIARILRLAFIAPHIVEEISAGSQPVGLTAHLLMRGDDLPPIWSKQREVLGS